MSAPSIHAATLYYLLEVRTNGLKRDVSAAKVTLGDLTGFIRANPMVAVAALGASLALVGAKAYAMARDFETSMTKVSTVTNGGAAQLKQFSNEVLALGRNLPVENFGQLADGLYQILSSGIDASKAMGVLEVSAKTAIGGFTDIKTVADVVTSAMNAYSDSNLTAQRAADIMARAVAVGKVEMGELSSSLGQVIGIASTFGVSLEELSGLLAALSLSGVKTAEGVTGIRSAIQNILRPADEFQSQFTSLSKAFDENRLKRDGFIKFLLDFQKESGGSSEALKSLFRDTQGYNAVVTLLRDNGVKMVEVSNQVAQSNGAVDETFKRATDSADSLSKQIGNELSAAFTNLGNKILPFVKAELAGVLGLIQLLRDSNRDVRVDSAAATVSSLAPLVNRFAKDSEEMKRFNDAARELLSAVSEGVLDIAKLSADAQRRLRTGLEAFVKSSDSRAPTVLNVAQLAQARQLIQQINEALAKTPRTAIAVTATGPKTPPPLTAAEKEKLAKEREKDLEEAGKSLDKFLENIRERTRTIADVVVEATDTMVDNMQLALNRMVSDLRQKGASEADIALVTNIQEGMIRVQKEVEKTQKIMDSLGDPTSIKDLDRAIGSLLGRELQLGVLIGKTQNPDEKAKIGKQQLEVHNKRIDLQTKLNDLQTRGEQQQQGAAEEADKKRREAIQHVRQLASDIADAANAALSLAAAFGVVDEKTQKLVSNVIDLGAGIARIFAGDVKGGALQGASGLTSLIAGAITGPREKARARRDANAGNSGSVADLIEQGGDFGRAGLTGTQVAGVERAVDALVKRFGTKGDHRDAGDVDRTLAEFGVPAEKLQAVARSLGIELDGSVGSFKRLQEALKALDIDSFGSGLIGKLKEIEVLEQAAGKTDALDALKKRIEAITGEDGAPALARALEGLDLDSSEGRAAAIEKLTSVLSNLKDLKPGDLGGFSSVDQFISSILDTIGRLRGIDLTPIQKFNAELGLLDERFRLLGGTSAERFSHLKKILETLSGGEFGFLGGDDTLPDVEEVRRRAKDAFERATADGIIDESERAILDGYERILEALVGMTDEATRAVEEAARKEEERRDTILTKARNRVAFNDIDDPMDQLNVFLDAYREAFPQLEELLGGLDVDPDNLAALDEELRALFESLGDDAAPELIDAILAIESAIDGAANSLASAAAKISAAFSNIDLEARVFGKSAGEVIKSKGGVLGVDIDTGTTAGRNKGIADLQELFKNAKDDATREAIAHVIDGLRGLPEISQEGGGATAVAGGGKTSESTARRTGIESVDARTGGIIADRLTTLVSIEREHIGIARQLLAAAIGSAIAVMPPSFRPTAVGGGGDQFSIVIHIHANDGANSIAEAVRGAIPTAVAQVRSVDRTLDKNRVNETRFRGSNQV
jgi:TP901 family phage tail tape measure protein